MADNSLSSAQTLGALKPKPVVRRNVVNLGDPVDFFKFTLRRSSNVSFRLSELQSNADLALLNAKGRVLGRSRKSDIQEEAVSRRLAAGTYYVQVLNRTSFGTRYKLTGSTGTSAINGTLSSPINLGTLTNVPVVRSRDTAGSTPDSAKYYKFQLGQVSTLGGSLTQVTGGGAIDLYYDSNLNGKLDLSTDLYIAKATGSQSGSSSPFFEALPTGTYFLKATQGEAFTTMLYDFTLRPTLIPGSIPTDPGSEPATAFNLGTLNPGGRLEVSDYVGEIDDRDVYRFSLSTTSRVSLIRQEFNGARIGSLDFFMYQDKNNNSLFDNGEFITSFTGSNAELIVDLQAGDYYLAVRDALEFHSAYTVNLTA